MTLVRDAADLQQIRSRESIFTIDCYLWCYVLGPSLLEMVAGALLVVWGEFVDCAGVPGILHPPRRFCSITEGWRDDSDDGK
jgi:hypothetical protein